MFPPAREPTPFRLKQLVEDMYGSVTARTDWSKPFTLGHEGTQSVHTDTCNTNTGSSSNQDTDDESTFIMDEDQTSDQNLKPRRPLRLPRGRVENYAVPAAALISP
ncbi:hypothetical protein E2C01_015655 [Portunus trituberculatus]|uniref:Uncharacterized protein n=1 Tax=Portunus trituberculatus TaxID=210409 RepID=A0A5B7DN77_PORTR|nr:hypothetical protein [Portunus trituberculatus]